ncbi:hypothetical protein Jiend_26830 [Micromonospora endophytica]|nr:hypothetical protein Jiend_26830 [Micromonospora endophytica]
MGAQTSAARDSLAGYGYLSQRLSASLLRRHQDPRHRRTFRRARPQGWGPPWAGDFRPANSAGNGPKNAVGKTFTLELPDGSTGKVVVQGLKRGKGGVVLALMGEDAPPF